MAGSGVTGDFGKLTDWAKRLRASDRVLRSVAKNMAEEALDLVAQGFADEKDPYGRAWAKLKVRRGKILQDTARLKRSWHRVKLSETGFTIAAGASYATFHQAGTKRMAARKMVPDGGNLPASWRAAMLEAAHEVLAEHFRGQR